jgi:hypothetical protein
VDIHRGILKEIPINWPLETYLASSQTIPLNMTILCCNWDDLKIVFVKVTTYLHIYLFTSIIPCFLSTRTKLILAVRSANERRCVLSSAFCVVCWCSCIYFICTYGIESKMKRCVSCSFVAAATAVNKSQLHIVNVGCKHMNTYSTPGTATLRPTNYLS